MDTIRSEDNAKHYAIGKLYSTTSVPDRVLIIEPMPMCCEELPNLGKVTCERLPIQDTTFPDNISTPIYPAYVKDGCRLMSGREKRRQRRKLERDGKK